MSEEEIKEVENGQNSDTAIRDYENMETKTEQGGNTILYDVDLRKEI